MWSMASSTPIWEAAYRDNVDRVYRLMCAAALGVTVTYAKVLQHRALRRAAQLVEVDRWKR